MRLILIGLALAVVLLPGAAMAGSGCGAASPVQALFEGADSNQDGMLTEAEYTAAGLEAYGMSFEESDLDSDGVTSLSEYIELYEMHPPPAERREA